MRFEQTALAGVYVVEPEPRADERGFFARTWCAREFAEHGLDPALAQCSVSYNHRAGTLRGLHFQAPPTAEAKLVRCVAGAIYDVAVDLRPASRTYQQWRAVELTAANRRALYLPPGFAHGFQTLVDASEVFYQISVEQAPELARGYRHDDAAFGIAWPLPVSSISERDLAWPEFALGSASC